MYQVTYIDLFGNKINDLIEANSVSQCETLVYDRGATHIDSIVNVYV